MVCVIPGITEFPALCRGCLEVGSTHIWLILLMAATDSAPEHLKVPVPGALLHNSGSKVVKPLPTEEAE